jgi:hypothetical protein
MCRRECEMRMKVFSCVIGLILLIERESRNKKTASFGMRKKNERVC